MGYDATRSIAGPAKLGVSLANNDQHRDVLAMGATSASSASTCSTPAVASLSVGEASMNAASTDTTVSTTATSTTATTNSAAAAMKNNTAIRTGRLGVTTSSPPVDSSTVHVEAPDRAPMAEGHHGDGSAGALAASHGSGRSDACASDGLQVGLGEAPGRGATNPTATSASASAASGIAPALSMERPEAEGYPSVARSTAAPSRSASASARHGVQQEEEEKPEPEAPEAPELAVTASVDATRTLAPAATLATRSAALLPPPASGCGTALPEQPPLLVAATAIAGAGAGEGEGGGREGGAALTGLPVAQLPAHGGAGARQPLASPPSPLSPSPSPPPSVPLNLWCLSSGPLSLLPAVGSLVIYCADGHLQQMQGQRRALAGGASGAPNRQVRCRGRRSGGQVSGWWSESPTRGGRGCVL